MIPKVSPPLHSSTLELLLLAMVKRGLHTSYDLLSKVGISVGGTSRGFKRLESAGLLTSSSGPRTSQRFALTKKGEAELKRCWQSISKPTPPASLESALRVLFLGWLFGEPSIAANYARWAVDELRYRAKEDAQEADAIRDRYAHLWQPKEVGGVEHSVTELGSVYRLIKLRTDATRARAEADSLESAIKEVKTLIPIGRLRGEPSQRSFL
jgi:DNA-binding PadR family transcriptional regulator